MIWIMISKIIRKIKVTGIVGRKSVSLHWEPVSGDASWPKLAGSCPSKWQQLLAVRESMSQSEEKSDGIYINTTLMAHLALRRVPGCATDSQAFDRQSPAHQTRMACQMAGRRLRGAQICQTLSDAVVTQAREVKASFHTWLVLDMDGGREGAGGEWLHLRTVQTREIDKPNTHAHIDTLPHKHALHTRC